MVTIYICYTLNEPTFKKFYFVERIFMSLPVYRAYQINCWNTSFQKVVPLKWFRKTSTIKSFTNCKSKERHSKYLWFQELILISAVVFVQGLKKMCIGNNYNSLISYSPL